MKENQELPKLIIELDIVRNELIRSLGFRYELTPAGVKRYNELNKEVTKLQEKNE